jgi:hypothetical protein
MTGKRLLRLFTTLSFIDKFKILSGTPSLSFGTESWSPNKMAIRE